MLILDGKDFAQIIKFTHQHSDLKHTSLFIIEESKKTKETVLEWSSQRPEAAVSTDVPEVMLCFTEEEAAGLIDRKL